MASEHSKKLIKEQKAGDGLISVDVLVSIVEAYYSDYTFYCYYIRGKRGCIIALPFFTYDKKENQKLEGYLIYHDKDSYSYSEKELYKLGVETIGNYSPSGMAGKLWPLPYKPISEDDIEDALDSLIEKNTVVNLTDSIIL
jgi:hypothetical protein